jgi:hypothetical protein
MKHKSLRSKHNYRLRPANRPKLRCHSNSRGGRDAFVRPPIGCYRMKPSSSFLAQAIELSIDSPLCSFASKVG